jgi:RNA polymerase sigma-70 factor, ECF subfamily
MRLMSEAHDRVWSESGEQASAEWLDELFVAHHVRLYRLARRLSRDSSEALDLVQEAFLRAARRPAAVPQGAGAEPWLVRTLVNLCRDRWRRQQVRARSAPELRPRDESGPDAEAAELARAAVQEAIALLPPRRRAVVVLHELEGLDAAEIARQLGVTQVTVRWHLLAGRRDLRRILAEPAEPGEPRRSPK